MGGLTLGTHEAVTHYCHAFRWILGDHGVDGFIFEHNKVKPFEQFIRMAYGRVGI